MKSSFDKIIQTDTLVIIDFYAEWCAPCKAQSPTLKDIAVEFGDKIKIIKINVDNNQKIAAAYKIQSIPTIMFFKNGKIIYRQAGIMQKNQIVKLIIQYA